MLRDPLAAARLAVTPEVKAATMAWLAGVLLFLPLLSPITLAALPLLAERMLASSQPNWWGTTYQYNAFIEIVLVCAAVDGAARIAVGRARPGPAAIVTAAAGEPSTPAAPAASAVPVTSAALAAPAASMVPMASAASVVPMASEKRPGRAGGRRSSLGWPAPRPWPSCPGSPSPAWPPPGSTGGTARCAGSAAAADAEVPPGVTVDAAQMLGPQLSGRDTVLLWGPSATSAAWIVAQTRYTYPFLSLPSQRARIGDLERRGYQVDFRRGGYLVLHRPSAPQVTSRARRA